MQAEAETCQQRTAREFAAINATIKTDCEHTWNHAGIYSGYRASRCPLCLSVKYEKIEAIK
jgi:hypothetical protein